MSVETFANCFAGQIGRDVDSVLDSLQSMGEDGIRQVADWWSGLDDKTRQLIVALAASVTSVLTVILTKVLNQYVAAALVLFLGAAAWTDLMFAFSHCIGSL